MQFIKHLIYSQSEHMVFKGSEKYPGEIDFYEFTRKAGGDTHARTHYYYTEYGFEAYDEYLDETLDRFSQFFKAPLMPKESLLREREAVDSEFALKKTDNNEHIYQMVSSLGEKTHPSSVFQCGNLKTLKENIDDDELYRKAQEFRKRHYSAHRMYLSLQSNRSLDNLQVRATSENEIRNCVISDESHVAFTFCASRNWLCGILQPCPTITCPELIFHRSLISMHSNQSFMRMCSMWSR